MRVLIFNVNADGVALCESDQQAVVDQHRKGSRLSYLGKCKLPTFQKSLNAIIARAQADIIVYAFQDEPAKGTYFHSEYLKGEMSRQGYVLAERDVSNTPGVTLRTSVYLVDRGSDKKPTTSTKSYTYKGLSSKSLGSSALAIYLDMDAGGKWAFININAKAIPVSQKDLSEDSDELGYKGKLGRQKDLLKTNEFITNVYTQLAVGKGLSGVFICGDWGYRMLSPISKRELLAFTSEQLQQVFQDRDELTQQLGKQLIPGLLEAEVKFFPTCQEKKGSSYYTGWCDRVLYNQKPGVTITPVEYNTIADLDKSQDQGIPLALGPHMAIYGLYDITN